MVSRLDIEWKRRLMILGILAGVFLGYRYLLPVVFPFLAAWILAAWIYPAAVKIEKKLKIKRTVAGSVVLTGIFALAGGLLYWGAAEIFSQIKSAVSQYSAWEAQLGGFVENCCQMLEDFTGIKAVQSRRYVLTQVENIQAQMTAAVSPETLVKIFAGIKGALVALSGLVVIFISTILILGDMENLRKKIWDYPWLVGTRRVVRRLQKTTVTYLKAQGIIMLLVAAVCALGFWILKSPYFLILGILLGALDALPLIGTGMFLYPAAVVLFIKGNTFAAAGCVLLDVITSLLREFLEPRLLGGKLGISPISVLAAVYIGVFLFGVWGVILGPLAFSTVYEIGREWDIWD